MRAFFFVAVVLVAAWLFAIHEQSRPRAVLGPIADDPGVDPSTYTPPDKEKPVLRLMVKPHAIIERGAGAVSWTEAPDTMAGELLPGPTYENMVPAHLQNNRHRDGIPYTSLVPMSRIDNPNNPYLELQPITAFSFYLRAIPPKRPRATPRTIVKYPNYPRQVGVTN
jgi:hypothetical protein